MKLEEGVSAQCVQAERPEREPLEPLRNASPGGVIL